MLRQAASSVVVALSLLALTACGQEREPNTPASETMQSDTDVRVGPTPTNDITTPGNPDSTGTEGAGTYPQSPATRSPATPAPVPDRSWVR
jgi:hypothetical protein